LRWFPTFIADGSCEILTIDDFESSRNLVVSPNPVSNQLRIDGEFQSNSTIQVFNRIGQIILDKKTQNSVTEWLDVSQLNTGIYLISVQHLGRISTAKFVKE